MKSTLKKTDRPGVRLFTIAGVLVANILFVSYSGNSFLAGGGGGYFGGASLGPRPGEFVLVSPPNDAPKDPQHTLLTGTPTLTWTLLPGATGYIVEMSKTNDFSLPLLSASVGPTTTRYTVPAERALQPGTHYYWRVTAYIVNTRQITASNAPFTFSPQ
jgi:hypothetical protein